MTIHDLDLLENIKIYLMQCQQYLLAEVGLEPTNTLIADIDILIEKIDYKLNVSSDEQPSDQQEIDPFDMSLTGF